METVAGGSYASTANAEQARENGVRRAVFNIRYGLGYHKKMGVKKKTFNKLKNFRAGVEGNISGLKRSLCMDRQGGKALMDLTRKFGPLHLGFVP